MGACNLAFMLVYRPAMSSSNTLSLADLRAARQDLDREEAARKAEFETDKMAFEADMQKFAARRADLEAAERVWQILSPEHRAAAKLTFKECLDCGFLFKSDVRHECSNRPGNAFTAEELDVILGDNWLELDPDDLDTPAPPPHTPSAAPNGHDQEPEPKAAEDATGDDETEDNETEGDGEDVEDMTQTEMVLAAVRRLQETKAASMRSHIDQFIQREFQVAVPLTHISTYLRRLKAEGLIENRDLSWYPVGE